MDTLPQPFSEEIKGIAAVSGIPLGEIFLFTFYLLIIIIVENAVSLIKLKLKQYNDTQKSVIH